VKKAAAVALCRSLGGGALGLARLPLDPALGLLLLLGLFDLNWRAGQRVDVAQVEVRERVVDRW